MLSIQSLVSPNLLMNHFREVKDLILRGLMLGPLKLLLQSTIEVVIRGFALK
jgi:hypothetical protein